MINLEHYFEKIPFHAELRFNKSILPNLPSGFGPSIAGDPRFGMLGQYRCGTLHAYDSGDCWLIHKDRWNPETHPWKHLVEDAPHWLLAGAIVGGALLTSALFHLLRSSQEKEKSHSR